MPQPRVKRRRTRIVVAICAALLLAVAFLALKIVRFARAQATITVDYGAQYTELTRPADDDPQENASTHYQEAFRLLTDMPPGMPSAARFRPQEASEAERRLVEQWVAVNHEALDHILEAAEKPYYWVDVPSMKDEDIVRAGQLGTFRRAAICLGYQAKLLAARGDVSQALRHALAAHKMGNHLDDPRRTQIERHVGLAIGALAQGIGFSLLASTPIPAELLREFQSELETRPSTSAALSAGDEIALLDAIQRYFTDDGTGNGHLLPGKVFGDYRASHELPNELAASAAYLRHLRIAWTHPDRKATAHRIAALRASLERLAAQTSWQLLRQGTSYEQETKTLGDGNYFLQHLQWPKRMGQTLTIHERCRAGTDALVTTIALLRYKQAQGAWPHDLETLVRTDYLREVPMDPFSGQALVYVPMGETFTLYSLGADFDDDGGTPSVWGKPPDGGDEVFWPVTEK